MKKIFKNLLSALICLSMIQGTFLCAVSAETEVMTGMQQRVFIRGSLGTEYADKTVTLLAVPKGADRANVSNNDILGIKQIKTDNNGEYEFLFEVNKVGDFDVYLNEGGTTVQKYSAKDYSESIFLESDFESIKKDGIYNIESKLKNIFGYADMKVNIFTAYYKGDVLYNVDVTAKDLSGDTTEWTVSKNVSVPEGVDKVKFFIMRESNLEPLTDSNTIYDRTGINSQYIEVSAGETVPYTSQYFKYSGRWLENTTTKSTAGQWSRSYVEFRTESDKAILVFPEEKYLNSAISVYVNGKLVAQPMLKSDTTNRTEYDISAFLTEDIDDVTVMTNYERAPFCFSGVKFPEGTRLYQNREKKYKMMFIGDSITSANGYSRLVPTQLDADFTTISRSAIALRNGKSYNNIADGMETRFKYYESVGIDNTPVGSTEFPFNDSYDVIFINLGTNDHLTNALGTDDANDFIARYNAFVSFVQNKYPDSEIVIIRPFNGGDEATDARKAENKNRSDIFAYMYKNGDFNKAKMHYWDTSELNISYINNPGDVALHPTEEGHKQITEKLIEYLKAENIIK